MSRNEHDRIARLRMRAQALWSAKGAEPTTAEGALRHLAASQAQEYVYAKWSLAQRAGGIGDAVVEEALARGAILRTHVLRPTWHFVLPEDLRWILAATAARVKARNATYEKRLELDGKLLAKAQAVLARALEGGRHQTREELGVVLEHKAKIVANGMRLAYVFMRAELDAVVCSGTRRGKQQTYALFDERVPSSSKLSPDEALAILARRYFAARGPATAKDLGTWASLTMGEARRAIELLGRELACEKIDKRTYWFTEQGGQSPKDEPKKRSPRIDLVQGYDECIMSYSESKDVLAPTIERSADGRTPFTHAILSDGRLLGHWKYNPAPRAVGIETFFYRSLDSTEKKELERAVDRFGAFLGIPATLVRG
jgi:hypothetical protein